MKIPFISNLKKPACASKQGVLELATLRYIKMDEQQKKPSCSANHSLSSWPAKQSKFESFRAGNRKSDQNNNTTAIVRQRGARTRFLAGKTAKRRPPTNHSTTMYTYSTLSRRSQNVKASVVCVKASRYQARHKIFLQYYCASASY